MCKHNCKIRPNIKSDSMMQSIMTASKNFDEKLKQRTKDLQVLNIKPFQVSNFNIKNTKKSRGTKETISKLPTLNQNNETFTLWDDINNTKTNPNIGDPLSEDEVDSAVKKVNFQAVTTEYHIDELNPFLNTEENLSIIKNKILSKSPHSTIRSKFLSMNISSGFFENCNDAYSMTKTLQSQMKKKLARFNKTINKKKPKMNQHDEEKQLLQNAYSNKKKMGLFIYGNGDSKNKGKFMNEKTEEVERGYKQITNMQDVAAFQNKDVIKRRFISNCDLINKYDFFQKTYTERIDGNHAKVMDLVEDIERRKSHIYKRLHMAKISQTEYS